MFPAFAAAPAARNAGPIGAIGAAVPVSLAITRTLTVYAGFGLATGPEPDRGENQASSSFQGPRGGRGERGGRRGWELRPRAAVYPEDTKPLGTRALCGREGPRLGHPDRGRGQASGRHFPSIEPGGGRIRPDPDGRVEKAASVASRFRAKAFVRLGH